MRVPVIGNFLWFVNVVVETLWKEKYSLLVYPHWYGV